MLASSRENYAAESTFVCFLITQDSNCFSLEVNLKNQTKKQLSRICLCVILLHSYTDSSISIELKASLLFL